MTLAPKNQENFLLPDRNPALYLAALLLRHTLLA